jgi:hypothetical protein
VPATYNIQRPTSAPLFLFLTLLWPGFAEARTAAPPYLQQEIRYLFERIATSNECRKVGKLAVLSSGLSKGAAASEGEATEDTIYEEWQADMCGKNVKYRITISPDPHGGLRISGFAIAK